MTDISTAALEIVTHMMSDLANGKYFAVPDSSLRLSVGIRPNLTNLPHLVRRTRRVFDETQSENKFDLEKHSKIANCHFH